MAPPSRSRSHLSTSPFRAEEPAPVHQFAVDDRVTHDRHGMGRVSRLVGDRIEVTFGTTVVSIACNSTKIHPL